ncbi:hypothetical protein DFQ28_003848 [Apophysomyces sp. BC1034]|nr:hypothetical protein DFQ30_002866 [Apophysomyces sp. BC1015]KAG0182182.1 hypothetical protein DFQ29_005398 [Apophysomyces sp. BC1021]KAG0193675.1 hypothetical protein DFQ28_003848 [Apophysomyces sp. BC1034]
MVEGTYGGGMISDYEDEDEYCPHCDNHYVLDAITPEAKLGIETEDIRMDARVMRDARMKMIKDPNSMFDLELSESMG